MRSPLALPEAKKLPSATPAIIQSNPVKNPGHRLRKLRRSRGSICPWFASFSGPIAILGHGISDGALQAAPLGRLDMAPHSAPFGGLCPPAIFLPWLACPGWQRSQPCRRTGRTCSRSDPSPSGRRGFIAETSACQFDHICLRPDPRRLIEARDRVDPFFATSASASPGRCFSQRSVRTISGAGQMQRVPVYRLTFASSPSRSRSTRSR